MRWVFGGLLSLASICVAKRTFVPAGNEKSAGVVLGVQGEVSPSAASRRKIGRRMDIEVEPQAKRRLPRLWDDSSSEKTDPSAGLAWKPWAGQEPFSSSTASMSYTPGSTIAETLRDTDSSSDGSIEALMTSASNLVRPSSRRGPETFFENLLVAHEWQPERPEIKGSKVGSRRALADEAFELVDQDKHDKLARVLQFIRSKGFRSPFCLHWDEASRKWTISAKLSRTSAVPTLRLGERYLEHYVDDEWLVASDAVYRQLGVLVRVPTEVDGRWHFSRSGDNALHAWHLAESEDGTLVVRDDVILWRVFQSPPEQHWFTGACEPGGKVFSLRYLVRENEVVLGLAETTHSGQRISRRWVLSESGPASRPTEFRRGMGTCASVGVRVDG